MKLLGLGSAKELLALWTFPGAVQPPENRALPQGDECPHRCEDRRAAEGEATVGAGVAVIPMLASYAGLAPRLGALLANARLGRAEHVQHLGLLPGADVLVV